MTMKPIDYPVTEPRLRYPGRRGIYVDVPDFEKDFSRLSIEPILANKLDITSEEGLELFKRLVYSKHDGDVFKNIPSCPCGHLKHGHLIGETCTVCGHPCLSLTEQGLEPIIWLEGLEPVKYFVNPQIYTQLSNFWTDSGFNVIAYLMDPKYRPPRVNHPAEFACKALKLPVGMVSFYNRFDEIMDILINGNVRLNIDGRQVRYTFTKPAEIQTVTAYLAQYRDRVFTRYLPFPSKVGFVIEDYGETVYGDHEVTPALNALYSIANASTAAKRGSVKDVESRMAKAVINLAEYHFKYEENKIFDKPGAFRKLIYGFRPNWSFRTVITSNHKAHLRDEVEMPWGTSIMVYKLHIANKLLKQNRTPNGIFSMIYNNVSRHHMVLERIFDELIAESPGQRGLPIAMTRYPSLKHGSTQQLWGTVKYDPRDLSTSMPPTNLVSYNADVVTSNALLQYNEATIRNNKYLIM